MKSDIDTKEKIFMVAAHLFAQKGYNGVSMREISNESGVTKPTIYYYFGSKQGIYAQLLRHGFEQVIDNFNDILSLNVSFKEKLERVLKNDLQLCIEHPEFIKFFMTLSMQVERNPIIDKLNNERAKIEDLFVRLLSDAAQSGEINSELNPEIAVNIISGTFSYYVWQQLNKKEKLVTDQLAETIVDHIFRGLNG
jgi:AcrR family transcriptional regulator